MRESVLRRAWAEPFADPILKALVSAEDKPFRLSGTISVDLL